MRKERARKIHKEKRTRADDMRDRIRTKITAHTVLWFGKYRGSSVRHVLNIDPEYIIWAVAQRIFKLDEEAEYELAEARRRESHNRQEAGRRAREQAERESGERARRNYRGHHTYGNAADFVADLDDDFEELIRNAFNRASGGTRQQQGRRSAPVTVVAKPVSPAAQWDHLPDRQKHASILRLGEVMEGKQLTKENIRVQYRKLMFEYHPDKFANAGPMMQQLAHEMSLRVNAAWEYFKARHAL